MDFFILGENFLLEPITLTDNQVKAQPESPYKTRIDDETDTRPSVYDLTNRVFVTNVRDKNDTDYNGRGICLLKDCREAISCNYNLQLATSSDTFVLSPFIFLPQKRNIKVVLLTKEVNKLSDGYLDVATFLTPRDVNDMPMNTLFTPP